MRVNAYAAPAAGQPLAPTTIERRDVGPRPLPEKFLLEHARSDDGRADRLDYTFGHVQDDPLGETCVRGRRRWAHA